LCRRSSFLSFGRCDSARVVRISLDSIPSNGTLVVVRSTTVGILPREPISLTSLFGFATGPTPKLNSENS
jgi:hypothetical protein